MWSRPLTNFEIQKYYQNEHKLNGFYSRNIFSKIKEGIHIINLDEYESIGTHATYFDSFGVEHIPKEIRKFIGNENITTDIYRIQAYDSIMCEYLCIVFIALLAK